MVSINASLVALDKADKGNEVVTGTAFDTAMRDGRAFSAGTGLKTVFEGSCLNQIFSNPSGSNKVAFVTLRAFYNDRSVNDESMLLRFIPSPVMPDDAVQVTPSNLKTGGVDSAMQFWTEYSATPINRDPPFENPPAIILPTGGQLFKIETPRIVEQGESFGFYMAGEDLDPDQVSINYVWYEEDI